MTDSDPVPNVSEETSKTEQQETSVTHGKNLFIIIFIFFLITEEVAVVPAENVVDQTKTEEKENPVVESSSDVETKDVERESKEPSSEPQFKDAEKVIEGEEEEGDDNDSEYEDVDEEEEVEEKNEAPVEVRELKFDQFDCYCFFI
jgi:cytoskeletal protein RodZ